LWERNRGKVQERERMGETQRGGKGERGHKRSIKYERGQKSGREGRGGKTLQGGSNLRNFLISAVARSSNIPTDDDWQKRDPKWPQSLHPSTAAWFQGRRKRKL
jgi:hypothetical protein